MQHKPLRQKNFVLIAPLLLILAGCATGAAPDAMAVSTPAATTPAALQNAFAVGTVSGGEETNPLWKSNVSNEDFSTALQQSLTAQSMLATGTPKYSIHADLVSLDQPVIALNTTVTATVHYTVTSTSSQKTVFDHSITTPYTATVISQPIGFMRLKLANEGAMKANILALLTQLQSLN